MSMVAVRPRRRWWRALFTWGAVIALTLSVATACDPPTGPPNPPPDEPEDPQDPQKQGFLVLPGSQDFLV
jgi:hypothetical protein